MSVINFSLLILLLLSCGKAEPVSEPISPSQGAKDSIFIVKRVIDGDTFELENGERVRLIGIDTPEKWQSSKLDKDSELSGKDKKIIQKLGLLCTFYADSLLYKQSVKLIPDSTNSDRDKYNRLLRYAYLENGELFNLKIIQDGYAYAYTKYPFVYMEDFRSAQRKARENKKGLWDNLDFFEMEGE